MTKYRKFNASTLNRTRPSNSKSIARLALLAYARLIRPRFMLKSCGGKLFGLLSRKNGFLQREVIFFVSKVHEGILLISSCLVFYGFLMFG